MEGVTSLKGGKGRSACNEAAGRPMNYSRIAVHSGARVSNREAMLHSSSPLW